MQAAHDEYLAAATLLSTMGRLEAKDLIPSITQYDPKRNFRKLRFSLGYVPWEEPIAAVDRALALPPIPVARSGVMVSIAGCTESVPESNETL